jgi:hypothetical protein
MNAVVILMLVVAATLTGLVITKRLQFPLLMDLGMSSVAIGLVLAADALHSDAACTPFVLAVRWGFVAGGFLLILIAVARKRSKGYKRLSDYRGLPTEDLKRVHGGKQ